MMFEPKIFCIGLMKTGTVSLAEALSILGYQVAHFDELRQIMEPTGGWLTGDFDTDWLKNHHAVLDNPVPRIFQVLDRKYPGSKFILTTRGRESWLESCKRYLESVPAKYEYRKLVRTSVYGMFSFHEETWIHVRERHHETVRSYFRNRRSDLLELDICNGQGWESLCDFLNKPEPKIEFPQKNRCPNYEFE